jgi:hypothetical protein
MTIMTRPTLLFGLPEQEFSKEEGAIYFSRLCEDLDFVMPSNKAIATSHQKAVTGRVNKKTSGGGGGKRALAETSSSSSSSAAAVGSASKKRKTATTAATAAASAAGPRRATSIIAAVAAPVAGPFPGTVTVGPARSNVARVKRDAVLASALSFPLQTLIDDTYRTVRPTIERIFAENQLATSTFEVAPKRTVHDVANFIRSLVIARIAHSPFPPTVLALVKRVMACKSEEELIVELGAERLANARDLAHIFHMDESE